ncbi:hypothetical protein LUZ60_014479 [Juncus effusus]|nr:hypothetical protein LUZ60_014479 [Juncus effusus]
MDFVMSEETEENLWFGSNSTEGRPPAESIVLVSLPEKYEEGKSTLDWALKYFSGNDSIWFAVVHVHAPIRKIPLMGVEIEAGNLGEEIVEQYRKIEKGRLNGILNKYLSRCRQTFKFKAFKLLVEAEDLYEGLLNIVRTLDVSKIVTETSSPRRTAPSEAAKKFMRELKPSCKIWFVSAGKLIFARISCNTGEASSSSNGRNGETNGILDDKEGEMDLDVDPQETLRKEAYDILIGRENAEKEMFWILQKSMLVTAKMTSELHSSDAQWRGDIHELLTKEKQENSHLKEEINRLKQELIDQREEMETRISEAEVSVKDIQSISAAARDHNESLEAEKMHLREQLNDTTKTMGELKRSLSTAEESYNRLLLERNIAARENEELRSQKNNGSLFSRASVVTEFDLEEIKRATDNFSDSKKIGQGGFGAVYKGFLRNTTVAVKKLDADSLQSRTEFEQEIAILSKVRHPNIVALIGSCPQSSSLVYEYLPNGSLEDRLQRKDNSPPLTWQQRTKIIGEVCSALIFLHATKPHPIVHGDLKPDNILLDANFVSKLGDFGIARLLQFSTRTSSFHHTKIPKGTAGYIDPEFTRSGELNTKSDVYSLGIIILRLVTGKNPLRLSENVGKATDDEFRAMIDKSAGDWPFVHAGKLAAVGVECSEVRRQSRPDLLKVWSKVEPLVKAALLAQSMCCQSVPDENHPPSYFVCPISQEIMKDPHIAKDGHTYELKHIKEWFDGHSTSPMTNLPLPDLHLIPNHPLRSAIQEWLQKLPRQ